MAPVASKGNEMNWKMKQPSDMPTVRFELRWLRYVAIHTTSYTMEATQLCEYKIRCKIKQLIYKFFDGGEAGYVHIVHKMKLIDK